MPTSTEVATARHTSMQVAAMLLHNAAAGQASDTRLLWLCRFLVFKKGSESCKLGFLQVFRGARPGWGKNENRD
jgi:hypothetical protein